MLLIAYWFTTLASLAAGLFTRSSDSERHIAPCPVPHGTIPNGTAAWSWPENLEDTRATPNTGKYKVLMVRHAQSLANTLDPYFIKSCTTSLGFAACNHSFDPLDSPLTATGIATAHKQGQDLTLISLDIPDVILVSPLLRTIQTAMNVIPAKWLHPAKDRKAPRIMFMPWLSEVVAPNTSRRDRGVWTVPGDQSCGHPPSQWFNATCPAEKTGATLDYNNTLATCQGYQGIKEWVEKHTGFASSNGFKGFYNKSFLDMWENDPREPAGDVPRQHAESVWQLLNNELSTSKVMIVSHHQMLIDLIDWPENSTLQDPFANHDGPKFLCAIPTIRTSTIVV